MVIRGGRAPVRSARHAHVVIVVLLIGLLSASTGPSASAGPAQTELSRTVVTDAGMCVLWQPEGFSALPELIEDVDFEEPIGTGALVPLYIHSDGVYGVVVRTGPLTSAEQRHVEVSSQPYLLVSRGSVALTGLESVGHASVDDVMRLPAGRYAATVHLIDRSQEQAAELPDFVVTLTPETAPGTRYRTSVETFER